MKPGAEQSFISGQSRLNLSSAIADPMRPSTGMESSFHFDHTLNNSMRSYNVAAGADNDKTLTDNAIQKLLSERPNVNDWSP